MIQYYIGVGFRTDLHRSLFYFRETNLNVFIQKLKSHIERDEPNFVSLRFVETKEKAVDIDKIFKPTEPSKRKGLT